MPCRCAFLRGGTVTEGNALTRMLLVRLGVDDYAGQADGEGPEHTGILSANGALGVSEVRGAATTVESSPTGNGSLG